MRVWSFPIKWNGGGGDVVGWCGCRGVDGGVVDI